MITLFDIVVIIICGIIGSTIGAVIGTLITSWLIEKYENWQAGNDFNS